MADKAKLVWWAGEEHWCCTYDKVSQPGSWGYSRCSNKAKHDHDEDGNPTRCGTHCKAATDKRQAKSKARYQAQKDEWARKASIQDLGRESETIIRTIAAGHNDPRSLCADWVKRMDEMK